jgi:thiamine kinase-like enzyme
VGEDNIYRFDSKIILFSNPYIEEGQTTQRIWSKQKGPAMIYNTLHRKIKIEQHEPKNGVEPRCPEG